MNRVFALNCSPCCGTRWRCIPAACPLLPQHDRQFRRQQGHNISRQQGHNIMRAILLAGAMTLAIVGNTQAGWFGLTEDYPFKKLSADRTGFIVAGMQACMTNPKTFAYASYWSRNQRLYMCNCRVQELANVTTQKDVDWLVQYNTYPATYLAKVTAADARCFDQMMDEDHQGN
jgi:hypothetical protein